MANHKSAEKRNRQRIVRTARARSFNSFVRSSVRTATDAAVDGSEDAAVLVKAAASLLDRAASKNFIPKKRAARLKSRLSSKLGK